MCSLKNKFRVGDLSNARGHIGVCWNQRSQPGLIAVFNVTTTFDKVECQTPEMQTTICHVDVVRAFCLLMFVEATSPVELHATICLEVVVFSLLAALSCACSYCTDPAVYVSALATPKSLILQQKIWLRLTSFIVSEKIICNALVRLLEHVMFQSSPFLNQWMLYGWTLG